MAQVFVGLAEQFVAAFGRYLPVGSSHSATDRNVQATTGNQVAQLLAEARGDEVALAWAGVLEEHDELVGAVTGDEIRGACRFHQGIGDRPQDVVADGVAEPIVDRVEMVDVEQHQKETALAAARTGGDARVEIEERPAAGQARQSIGRVACHPPIGIVESLRQQSGQAEGERWRALEALQEMKAAQREKARPLEDDDGGRAWPLGENPQLADDLTRAELTED